MRLSIASYLLLIISVCFLIQFQLVRLGEAALPSTEASDVEEQARKYYELYEETE